MAEATKRHLGWPGYLMIGVSILACAGGLLVVINQPKNGVTVEQVEADLKENLPPGSSLEAPEAWYAAHHIEPNSIYRGHISYKMGLVGAIPSDTLQESARVVISMTFNTDGRLEKCAVTRIMYNP